MNSRSGLCSIALLLVSGLLACSDAPEVTQEAPAERVVDTSVLDAARALLNQSPSDAIDIVGEDWQAELEVDSDAVVTADEPPRISTATRRKEDAEVLAEMAEFERLRDKARGAKRDQPLEVSLEER